MNPTLKNPESTPDTPHHTPLQKLAITGEWGHDGTCSFLKVSHVHLHMCAQYVNSYTCGMRVLIVF